MAATTTPTQIAAAIAVGIHPSRRRLERRCCTDGDIVILPARPCRSADVTAG
jgi:hypothetical protein